MREVLLEVLPFTVAGGVLPPVDREVDAELLWQEPKVVAFSLCDALRSRCLVVVSCMLDLVAVLADRLVLDDVGSLGRPAPQVQHQGTC